MLYRFFLICAISLAFLACDRLTLNKKTTIAKYKSNKLYLEDLVLRPGANKEDSAQEVSAMAYSWLQQQILLDMAKSNFTDSTERMDEMIENYKNALLVYYYEKQLSENTLNSNVNDSTLYQYYKENSKNFELKRNIVKIWYAKFNKTFTQLDDLEPYFKSNSDGDYGFVNEFCEQYAENYFVSNKDWLYFDEIGKEIPIDPSYDQTDFIQNNKFRKFEDEEFTYLLKIVDFKIKKNLSPFELVKDEIKTMILNEQRIKILKKNKKDLLNKALKNGEAKIY